MTRDRRPRPVKGGAASFCPVEAGPQRHQVSGMKLYRYIPLALAALVPVAALADVVVEDAYFRVSRPAAPTGAAFMELRNTGTDPIRFVGVASEAAANVMLHTHIEGDDGVMRMRHVEGGFEIPAGATLVLKRGGDHVMFMGVLDTWENGETVPLTLMFDGADDVTLDVTVDNDRLDHQHSGH